MSAINSVHALRDIGGHTIERSGAGKRGDGGLNFHKGVGEMPKAKAKKKAKPKKKVVKAKAKRKVRRKKAKK